MSNSATPEPGTERTLRSTTRNPRRRPRQSDAESQRSAPRRKRSKISENTFVPPRHDEEEEEEINGTIEVATMNGHIETPSPKRGRGRPRKDSAPMPPPAPPALDIEMPMRAKKTSVKRPTKGDGATVLAQNTRYTVKQLPSTPKELKRDAIEFRGSLGDGNHALAITREKAYIWDYSSHTPVNNPKVFDVPFPVRPTDELPFGALVTAGGSTDIGLVLISATTGKARYFESIERAASLGLFQERNSGVDGSLGSLFSGETVTDIISAQHAGFIVTLSSGRLAQLTLRDQQGKARIFAQFLRTTDPSSGGFFGSIKGLLAPGAWKRDLASVHTRQLGTRGQMQVISLTERAELQVWDLDWSGQYSFKSTIDFGEPLRRELRKAAPPELQGKEDQVTALDFAMLEPPSDSTAVATLGADLPLDILLLVKSGSRDHQTYALATVSIEGQNAEIPQVLNLSTYHGSSHPRARERPRLLLPNPRHTALIAFKHAVVLKQLDESDANSPEAQLHVSYIQPDTFEDSVYLKENQGVSILGACEEYAKGGPESAVCFVNGTGLVRFSVVNPQDLGPEEQISIKNKVEQAVFHGILQHDNIIDFSLLGDTAYSPEEIETAVLNISDEILQSTSPFISTSPTSIEAHFAYRAQALRALIAYARQNFPTLSQAAMWQLLWDAERVAAGLQLSKVFEGHVESAWQTKRKATVLDQVCEMMQERARNKSFVVSDNPVRNFWIRGLGHLGELLQVVVDMVDSLKTDDSTPSYTKIRLLKEACDVYHAALETAFSFRTENAQAYGILPDLLEQGVLNDEVEYAELPEFWTSTRPILDSIVKFSNLSREIAQEVFEKIADDEDEQAMITQSMVGQISENSPRIVELLCNMYRERINWLASRPFERDRKEAEKLRLSYDTGRQQQIRGLAILGQSQAGMKLAEQYRDMQTLTLMVVGDVQWTEDQMRIADPRDSEQIRRINEWAEEMRLRVDRYFQEFGDDWANAYFGEGFGGEHAGSMLKTAQNNWPVALTKYLQADQSRARLSWINDINMNRDFGRAGETLGLIAEDQEEQLWAKKVELSLGKLSLLAAQEDAQARGVDVPERTLSSTRPEREIDIAAIQDRLYWHLVPEITHCIDHQAEVEVAMQKFANKVHDLSALRQLLETYLDRVLYQKVLSADELIDTLTLLDNVAREGDDRNLEGMEFFLALKVLDATALDVPQDRFETLLQLLWKRCYVYDNWVEINNRQKQSDEEMQEKVRQTAPWRTLMHAAEKGFFDSSKCHVRHLRPSECLGAGCKPDDLRYRWSDPDMLDQVLHDNRIQDEQLASYVTDRNLDSWIEGCISDVKAEQERVAEQKAQNLERERQFEANVQQAKTNGNHNGHVPNGLLKEVTTNDVDDDAQDSDLEMQ